SFDPLVILPLGVGGVLCVVLFAKAANWAFKHHYAGMYHFILGMVVGSSLAIFPTVVVRPEAIAKAGLGTAAFFGLCAGLLVVGIICSWLFSKVEDRYSAAREEIDATRGD